MICLHFTLREAAEPSGDAECSLSPSLSLARLPFSPPSFFPSFH